MKKFFAVTSLVLALAAGSALAEDTLMQDAQAQFQPVPAQAPAIKGNEATPDKIELGKMLYFEPRLSKSALISCNTCHNVGLGGADFQQTSTGHGWKQGPRNSPTVFNSVFNVAQFWDGRAKDLAEQAKGPIQAGVEMNSTPENVVKTLNSMPEYVALFKKAFPGDKDPVSFDNMAKAIGAFERKLATPGPCDKYLAGDEAAMSDDAKHGLAVFMASGCTGCHSGPLLGGSMYMKTGLTAPYADTTDTGRFGITKAEADKFMFKVPSLRNVAKTAPYFHDGKIADLPAAIREMGKLQLGKTFTDDEVKWIGAFLDALTGEVPAALTAQPKLPKSGPKTPKPDPA